MSVESIIEVGQQQSTGQGVNLARRRYQRGSLYLRGDRWYGRWREDVLLDSGRIQRVARKEVIGTKQEYPTKRLAQRALDQRLSVVNSPTYRARPTATFAEFVERWQNTVLSQHKPSTRLAITSQLKRRLVPAFGKFPLRDLDVQAFQAQVSGWSEEGVSPKTIRNLVATLRMMWNSARAWGYVTGDPFEGLVLPKPRRAEARYFSADELQHILEAAEEPYRTFYWLAAETGMRAGELAGLRWEDVDVSEGVVSVRQSVWRGATQSPKSGNGVRTFAISSTLAARVGELRTRARADVPFVFATRNGTPLDPNLLVKRKLRPLLDRLGIERAGLHAFRHANATLLSRLGAPVKVAQARLGHSDPRMTVGLYAHVVGEDDKKIAALLGDILRPNVSTEGAALTVTA
jgi:integrase